MRDHASTATLAATVILSSHLAVAGPGRPPREERPAQEHRRGDGQSVQLGPRPFFLVDDMKESRRMPSGGATGVWDGAVA
jgi:hypothetical protein